METLKNEQKLDCQPANWPQCVDSLKRLDLIAYSLN